MDYVPYAVPFFLLAILVELTYGFLKKNNTYRLNDAISSLFMGSLRTANKLIFIGLGGYVFYLIETNLSLWRMDASSVFTWVFAFVVYDFFYYWLKRVSLMKKDHFKDIDKFVIVIYLINQDLIFFRKNGLNINYDTFYNLQY